MNSKFVKALVASLFATFAMTGCIADSQTELDSDEDADSDMAPDEDALETGDDAVSSGGASATSSCYNPIVSKPDSVKTSYGTTYVFTRYLKIDKYNMHVVGTASVSNWMMRETCLFNEAVVSAIKSSANRAKMSGFVVHITTFKDPPINAAGQRNGGGKLLTLISEEAVCGVNPPDPVVPDAKQSYHDWVVLAHETGHAIEHTLGLENSSDNVYKLNLANKYESKFSREYIAWGTQNWFGGSEKRSAMPLWERVYLRTSIFNSQNKWQPKCTR